MSLGIMIFTAISFTNMFLKMIARQSHNIVSRIEYDPNPLVLKLIYHFFLYLALILDTL